MQPSIIGCLDEDDDPDRWKYEMHYTVAVGFRVNNQLSRVEVNADDSPLTFAQDENSKTTHRKYGSLRDIRSGGLEHHQHRMQGLYLQDSPSELLHTPSETCCFPGLDRTMGNPTPRQTDFGRCAVFVSSSLSIPSRSPVGQPFCWS